MERMTQRNILVIAGCSRVIVFTMQVLLNWLNEDHKPDVFNPPPVAKENRMLDQLVEFFLEGFRRWDSIYFIHISEHGYTYENALAFFPGFPLLVRTVGFSLLYPLHAYMSLRHVLMIAAFLINTAAFVIAAVYVYKLGRELIGKGNHPWFAAVLFCFNPASIFMSAGYSESLFAMFSFALMYYIEKREFTKATIALGLATVTRSNGLVLAGYPLYMLLKLMLTNNEEDRTMINLARSWLSLTSCVLYGVLPFFLYQYVAFMLYCRKRQLPMPREIEGYGIERGYHLPADTPNEWCHYPLPFSYAYIQKNHWNVGFFHYYELKQWPNFLLATPVIILSLYTIVTYVYKCKDSLLELRAVRDWINSRPMRYFPYILHLLFLVIYGICTVHIQVLTRLIFSSTPLIYFLMSRYASQYFMHKVTTKLFKSVLTYFIVYFVVGTYMFSNFLPWT